MRLRLLLSMFVLAFLGGGAAVAQPAETSEATKQQRRPIPYPITPNQGFERAVEEGTRTRSGTPGPNYWTNTAEYELDATVDPEENVLRGSGTIQYHNNSPDTLRQLVLHLRQNIHKKGAIRNRNAEITGGMTLDQLNLPGADTLRRVQSRGQLQRLGQGYSVQDTRLVVFPPQSLSPDSTATINVE